MLFELLQGDICVLKADAIVNAASTSLGMGGGVALAIKQTGGSEIEIEALEKAPIDLGEAICTTAGNLSAKKVIHAATMHLNGTASAKSIKDCVKNSLCLADSLSFKSIAFPALGCGVGKYGKKSGAKIILQEIKNFNSKNLGKAFVVLHSGKDFIDFKRVAEKIFPDF